MKRTRLSSWLVSNARSNAGDKNGQKKKEPKSVGLVSGFFFNINFIVGTGFLSVPYAFYRAGTLTATLTLLALSFVSWNTANWIIETMARTQVSLSVHTRIYYKSYIVLYRPYLIGRTAKSKGTILIVTLMVLIVTIVYYQVQKGGSIQTLHCF